MRLLKICGFLMGVSAALRASQLPETFDGFSLRAEPTENFAVILASNARGVGSVEWPGEESRITREISRIRDMGALAKKNVNTGFGSLVIVNGHVDVVDKFEKAYLLYTELCIDSACKQFKVSEFSVYFERPVEGEIESKDGPVEAEARCEQTLTAMTFSVCLNPEEFEIDVKDKGSYFVSGDTYWLVVVGQPATFTGFGPVRWTPAF